jgi:hypothetical protein
MLGREREVATDVLANHPPLSKQRAVLQYRALSLDTTWWINSSVVTNLGALQISWFIFGDKFQGSVLDIA